MQAKKKNRSSLIRLVFMFKAKKVLPIDTELVFVAAKSQI